jgi:hypothetical protein
VSALLPCPFCGELIADEAILFGGHHCSAEQVEERFLAELRGSLESGRLLAEIERWAEQDLPTHWRRKYLDWLRAGMPRAPRPQ